jgi:hypothetical protein
MFANQEAIQKIVDLAQPAIHALGDDQFVIGKTGGITQIVPQPVAAEPITLHSLDALVWMVKTEALEMYNAPIYIEALGHNDVACFLRPVKENRLHRPHLYSVVAKDVPGLASETNLPFEQAMIAVRTSFQPSSDSDYLLKLLSEITCGAKVTYADNGIATSIVQTKGIALQEGTSIRPIVSLKPYRTFQEIEQPASEFHIRISEKGIRFIESDGGMWKLAARKTIVEYLREHLAEFVDDGRVVVML